MRILRYRCINRTAFIIFLFLFSTLYYTCISNLFHIMEFVLAIPLDNFTYPLEIDMPTVVDKILLGQKVNIHPLNKKYAYSLILNADRKCKKEDGTLESIFLLILIKSSIENFEQRNMIRRTWAQEYGVASETVKRVFLVGVSSAPADKTMQGRLSLEQEIYNDIVQQNFIDAYFNNTLKLIMGFQWATEFCGQAQFVAFFDDDYYVNINRAISMLQTVPTSEFKYLIIGYVWTSNIPYRSKDSKWYISMEEYPFRYYPPYVTAGSFFIPMQTVRRLYVAMQFTKIIRFDDVYLGIVAWKLKVRLRHNPNLYYFDFPYDAKAYRNVIAAHEFKDPELLYRAWMEQTKLDDIS